MFFNKKEEVDEIENKIIDNIKALNIDILNTKHNGNFDISLGLTKTLYTLYSKHLKINPEDPKWLNRDRVVLSSSSAYSLMLSTLYMSGYNITLDTLKKEYKIKDKIDGIDIISDTFSEGIASALGIAIGQSYLESSFKDSNLYNFYTYVICSDLDIIKGTSYEALSLAGALNLDKLIIIFDNNKNVLNDKEKDIFNIDIIKYFESLNINTIIVDKNDLITIDDALNKAKANQKPTVIILNHDNSHDRFENNYIDNNYVLTEQEISDVKEELGVRDIPFTVSNETREAMINMINERVKKDINSYEKAYSSLDQDTKDMLDRWKDNDTSLNNTNINCSFDDDSLEKACFKILNTIGSNNKFFIGGTSNFDKDIDTNISEFKDFSKNNRSGKIINYGLRENAIGSIQNGISLTGLKNFSITSLRTVSKLISSIKIASEYNLDNIYILVEDDDTLIDGINIRYNSEIASLRNIPNLDIFRPCDINELLGVFNIVTSKKDNPSCIIISKDINEIFKNSSITDVKKGAYILDDEDKEIDSIIVSSGQDIKAALDISNTLKEKGIDTRVVSMPSIELFLNNNDKYKEEILPSDKYIFFIEKASSFGLNQFVDNSNHLITPDNTKWYQDEDSYNDFVKEVVEKIENIIK